jgi:hypothetical protein
LTAPTGGGVVATESEGGVMSNRETRVFPLAGGGYVVTGADGDAETVVEGAVRVGGSVEAEVGRLEGLVGRLREAAERMSNAAKKQETPGT